MPVVTYVEDIKLTENGVIVHRQMEDGYEVISVPTPCLLTAVKELNQPRYMSVMGIVDAYEKEITVWNHIDIGLNPENCGLNASPTQVMRSFTPAPKGRGQMLKGTNRETAQALVSALKERHII